MSSVEGVTTFFFRPFGIAIAIMQWIVLLYTVLGDYNPAPGFGSSYHPTALNYYMFVVNVPALFLAHATSSAIGAVLQIPQAGTLVYLLAAVPLITLQWLFLGSSVELVFRESRRDSESIRILEDTE